MGLFDSLGNAVSGLAGSVGGAVSALAANPSVQQGFDTMVQQGASSIFGDDAADEPREVYIAQAAPAAATSATENPLFLISILGGALMFFGLLITLTMRRA